MANPREELLLLLRELKMGAMASAVEDTDNYLDARRHWASRCVRYTQQGSDWSEQAVRMQCPCGESDLQEHCTCGAAALSPGRVKGERGGEFVFEVGTSLRGSKRRSPLFTLSLDQLINHAADQDAGNVGVPSAGG